MCYIDLIINGESGSIIYQITDANKEKMISTLSPFII